MTTDNQPTIQNSPASAESPEDYAARIKSSARRSGSAKLYSYNWMADVEDPLTDYLVEVRFKNTRKDFYVNAEHIALSIGDVIAVEANPGHDIGIVSMIGPLVAKQVQKVYGKKVPDTFKKIYRKAKPTDIDKWREAKALEHKTMIRSRQIAKDLHLNMKIGDVEFQGDKTKAIFYYIADERVDFRELIKLFADEFKIRIEMRQIGVRQEAGRIGGIGLCGRDLCCSSFLSNFVSVSTNAARYQELSLNPQKMAGQCGKLKCCLNYELAGYMDARKDFPPTNVPLEFKDGKAHHVKTDVYRGLYTYQYKKDDVAIFEEISVERAKEIIELNRRGVKPESLNVSDDEISTERVFDYENVVGQESLTRFDKSKKKKKNKNKAKGGATGQNQQNQQVSAQNPEQQQQKPQVAQEAKQAPKNGYRQQNQNGQQQNNRQRHNKNGQRQNNDGQQQNNEQKNS